MDNRLIDDIKNSLIDLGYYDSNAMSIMENMVSVPYNDGNVVIYVKSEAVYVVISFPAICNSDLFRLFSASCILSDASKFRNNYCVFAKNGNVGMYTYFNNPSPDFKDIKHVLGLLINVYKGIRSS